MALAASQYVNLPEEHVVWLSDVLAHKGLATVSHDDIPYNYEVTDEIARGGFGSVHIATLRKDARYPFSMYPEKLALKVVRPKYYEDDEFQSREVERIASEIIFAKRFEDVGVRVYFVAVGCDAVTIAMELAGDALPAQKTFDEYPLDKRMKDLAVTASKLASINKEGVIHCDVKVENILMNTHGEPAIVDFGFAMPRGTAMNVRGTLGYMPPEAWMREYYSDTFSLGLVAYLMIFEGREPTAVPEGSKHNFTEPWLALREDLRVQAALRMAEKEAPGDTFLERMESIQKQQWIRDLLRLLDLMLNPGWGNRLSMTSAACELNVLLQNMRRLGPQDLQKMLREAIVETDPYVANCNMHFLKPLSEDMPKKEGSTAGAQRPPAAGEVRPPRRRPVGVMETPIILDHVVAARRQARAKQAKRARRAVNMNPADIMPW